MRMVASCKPLPGVLRPGRAGVGPPALSGLPGGALATASPPLVPAPRRPRPRLRRRVRRFLERPAVDVAVLLLIFISVALLVVEIALGAHPRALAILDVVNHVLTAVFAIELSLRFWVAKRKVRFFQRYWLDILALLPVIRPLRMLRLLRLLRLWRAGRLLSRRMLPFQGVFQVALTELVTLGTITGTLVLSAALLLHLVEGGPFADLEQSLWFAVLSLVAGEPIGGEPATRVGRWTTLALMVGGLTVFGMFVGTISASMGARLARRMEGSEMDLDGLEDHVVVCGWNGSAPVLIQELFAAAPGLDQAVVVVTETAERPPDWPWEGVRADRLFHVQGDWTRLDVLEGVAIREAATCILLRDVLTPRSDQDRDARTVLAALTVEQVNPSVYTVAELHSPQSESMLRLRGVEEVIIGEIYAGMILGSASQNPGLARLLDDILDLRTGNAFRSTRVPPALDGATVGQLRDQLQQRFGAILMSVEPEGGAIDVNPDAARRVRAGETLMVVSRAPIRW
jgi:voltage-gated potassium channel